MKKVFSYLTLLLLMWSPSIAVADNPQIQSGLNWLISAKNGNEYWGCKIPAGTYIDELADEDVVPTYFRDTCEATDTLYSLNQTGTDYTDAINWLSENKPTTTEKITRKIEQLSRTLLSYTNDLNLLLSHQNADGGFGGYKKFKSNNLDSVFALRALNSAKYSDTTVIEKIKQYILSNQNFDGGWGFKGGSESKVYYTALVSSTLQQFSQTPTLATAINKATSYLIAHQNADGGFGSSSSTVYETALSYIALLGVTTDNTVLGNAINYLINTQMPNGSWLQDPYSTALALRALHVAVNPPPSPTTGTVTGKLVDASTNQPLGGVTVVSGQLSATTTNTGEFTLSDMPAGNQTIFFTLAGYATATTTVNITAGSIINLGTIPLSTNPITGIIKGTVTDAENGQPLSDVTITVTGSFTGSTITGTDGSFIFTNVTIGTVTITTSKTSYYSVIGTGTVVAGGTLFFNPQLSTTPPTATTGNLTGKVFDSFTNTPIQGATIALSRGPSTTTDTQGVFFIKDITPNTYQVTISATGYISQIYQVMIIAGVTTDMQTIYLTPAPQATTITGKVTDAETGKPITGAEVLVIGTNLSVKTDATGTYTITGINLLEFSVKASAVGYDSLTYSIKTPDYGIYTVDFSFEPSFVSTVKIISLTTDKESYPANDLVTIIATLENTGDAAFEVTVNAQIADHYGNILALVSHDEGPPYY